MRRSILFGCGAAVLLVCTAPLRAQPAAPAEPSPAPEQRKVAPDQAVAVLGLPVTFGDGKPVGRVVDVLVNDSGVPEAAVLDCGGFMGMGARRVAVAWTALHFAPAEGRSRRITIDLTPDQVRSAPEYKEAKPAAVVTPPAAPAAASQ